eukprot:TRINITY_DN23109_c0_g1_i1.p1 TRINITY_DN23109_c0_g1~~TRINITY_DN23109_c0_g1_i1.p1  ORF type:complete len:2264 (+),score=566.09 TRINITY_DN23109_c0_g1_i1:79-6870(+)
MPLPLLMSGMQPGGDNGRVSSERHGAPDVVQSTGDKGPTLGDSLDKYVIEVGGAKPIRRILIASNGMAAAKAMISLRQWAAMEANLGSSGVFHFVAMATRDDLDANADFVRLADSFVEVPPGKNVNNYANVDLICKIAKSQSVDAVWPGWGHASENPALPAKLKELGISFIGPTSSVMAVLGDKIAAGILAQTAGVPSIPWSGDGLQAELTKEGTIPDETFKKACLATVEEAVTCAERIGYPVVLKASEGGGGKGIRMSKSKEELLQHFPQVQGEVPGSPIFMMQLCSGARHIEVQIVGDQHGQVVALNGRDCSTQRRFQKIFEEGPPVIVPKDKFKEMERAAQRLTQSIGYIGAGTIEYLYNATTNSFFFLELNPRLQVEHPVTEAITQVNLPATQLQVAMGVPLHKMPQIRRFYGKATADTASSIDFMKEDYVYPKIHCMASRITAENPDDGFKPTSGKIERIKFQSSIACWGYFSVGTHAAIHEFADSQFGHLFARGTDREEARKTLQLALKNLEVVGEIRNPVDYLVELLDTQAFVENSIDTSWLDGIIREKSVKVKYNQMEVVFYAAVVRAMRLAEAKESEALAAVEKRRLGLLGLVQGSHSQQLDIAFEGKKYNFTIERAGSDLFIFSVGLTKIAARIRVQPDASMLVTIGDSVMKVRGTEEPLGLRLWLQGVGTVLLPTLYDLSELRSEFNGKVIRYLIDDGASVKEGEPYIELEAMKMIMPLKAGATGKLKHLKGAGSIVQAGELLGRLTLDDPSSVQHLETFSGHFQLHSCAAGPVEAAFASAGGTPLERALLALQGYAPLAAPKELVQEIFPALPSAPAPTASEEELQDYNRKVSSQWEAGRQMLVAYLNVERRFAELRANGLGEDLMVAALIEEGKDDPSVVASMLQAHSQLKNRSALLAATLEALEGVPNTLHKEEKKTEEKDAATAVKLTRAASQRLLETMRNEGNWKMLADHLNELAEFPSSHPGYSQVILLARRLCQRVDATPWLSRQQALRDALKSSDCDVNKVAGTWSAHTGGCNILASLFSDSAPDIRQKALEVFVRRSYRAFGVSKDAKIRVNDNGLGSLAARWRFRHPGVTALGSNKSTSSWQGLAKVLPDMTALKDFLATDLSIGLSDNDNPKTVALGRLHLIILGDEVAAAVTSGGSALESLLSGVHVSLRGIEAKLRTAGMSEVVLVLPRLPMAGGSSSDEPYYAQFSVRLNWAEVKLARELSPTVPCLLELERLAETFQLERLGKVAADTDVSEVFLATPTTAPTSGSSGKRGKANPTIFVRSASHARVGFHKESGGWAARLESMLLTAVHELECARLTPQAKGAEGRIFLHLTALCDMKPQELYVLLESFTSEFAARHGAILQQLWVDEIIVKVRLGAEKDGCNATLCFTASSASGEYMKCVGLLEEVDPTYGNPSRWVDLATGTPSLPAAATDSKLRAKRDAARRAGSTYAPEFLGLLEAALVKQWASFNRVRTQEQRVNPPKDLFRSTELLLDSTGELRGEARAPGTNDIGMLAWRCCLKTPEYPDGRSIVLIANDVTHQAGSFGVVEDLFFKKATEYARTRGLPRIYIACNSGARVGLVDELMPKIRVKWIDEADPAKGFDYLYLSKEDYSSLPPGAVLAKEVPDIGFAIQAIVGHGLGSIAGGIGVENLQGSGLIAGETSRAYQDIFTLSYVTGRSVGIGAYLNRLGQRTIQAVDGPMVLTGYSALNKLLGRDVYSSQDQLGGPQVMAPNGVTHQLVQSDQEGSEAILQWLSYVPQDATSAPPATLPVDLPSRPVEFLPTKQPYDPRHMLAGTTNSEGEWLGGFFDQGSFQETLSGWGRSVVVGRARLGGVPMGVIAVETRNVERRIPADPGNPDSREIVEQQAGQVWFPDSAFKTATAIRDFNRGENLPLMIFANWRGFSGGTRDMYGEVLKFGAQIVDALVEYQHPVFIYIPPGGELRGGSWVVVDPAINPDVMEMYADEESRGGILEPAGIVEVKFRAAQRGEMMHRLDTQLLSFDAQLKAASGDLSAQEALQTQIRQREEKLQPLYTQVACEFADLHDRAGRMKAVGAVRESLAWRSSREFFYWRLRRRLAEQRLVRNLQAADAALSIAEAHSQIQAWLQASLATAQSESESSASQKSGEDRSVVELLEKKPFADKVKAVHKAALQRRFVELRAELEEVGQLSSARRSLFRCLFPAASAPASKAPDAAKSAGTGKQQPAYPALLASRGAPESKQQPKQSDMQQSPPSQPKPAAENAVTNVTSKDGGVVSI